MMNDNEFLSAFEICTLPFEQWTHRDPIADLMSQTMEK